MEYYRKKTFRKYRVEEYAVNIEEATSRNNNFFEVIWTGANSQLVLVSLNPGEDIGNEIHKQDQFIRVEKGFVTVQVVYDSEIREYDLPMDYTINIPGNMEHNIIAGEEGAKLYVIYSPPKHSAGEIQVMK